MKVPALFRWFLVSLFLFTIVFPPPNVFGSDFVYTDSFSNLDNSHWDVFQNSGGTVQITDSSYLSLSSVFGASFPYMNLKNVQFPLKNFSVEATLKFSGDVTYGNGIIFSDKLLPNGTSDDLVSGDLIFAAWPLNSSLVDISTSLCLKESADCSNNTYTHLAYVPTNEWFKILITEKDGYYSISVGENTFQTRDSSRIISQIWIGNPQTTNNSQKWPTITLDSIKISDNSIINKTPVFIIPGFGASWDIGAILGGVPGTHWQIPSFIKNYDGITESFKNAGYTEGTDLFVFPYDWRKPLTSLADDFKTFVDSKNLTGKIDLVGHSMGGLVARSYAQKYGISKVDKVLTAGSPHLGVVDMYGLWEGAKIWNGAWWQNVLLEIASEVNRAEGETKVDSVRRVSPSIIDLFPTFDFLVTSGELKATESMTQKNNYLKTLNNDIAALGNVITPFWSDDMNSTKKDINVTDRTIEDAQQNKWEDGRPVELNIFGGTAGDGSVTKESAVGPFGTGEKLTGWHSDLLSSKENIGRIFTKLGLDPVHSVSSETDSRENSFVAILRSPGILEVCNRQLTLCDTQLGGMTFPEYKLFILPGYNKDDLVVRVKASDLGDYKLHIGNIDESPDWLTFSGSLKTETQNDFYGVTNQGSDIIGAFDNQSPEIIINTPLEINYFTYNLPSLDYTVSDNWDTNPDKEVTGWSQEVGTHELIIKAVDDAGNVETKSIKYQIISDSTAPTVLITNPKSGYYQSSKLPGLVYEVMDDWDLNPVVDITGWSTEEGEHTVTVEAKDLSRNIGSSSVKYWVDNTPPTISITSPTANTYTSDKLPKLEFTTHDYLDSSPISKVSGWSTTAGTHTVKVTATDLAGNISEKSITYTILNRPEEKEFCKKDLWRRYWFLGFRNQGDCVKFVEKYLHTKKFFKIDYDHFWKTFWSTRK